MDDLLIIILFAALLGKLEGEIEGKNTWAANLPTWRVKNQLTDFILDGKPFTGYHLWLFGIILLLFHFFTFSLNSWSFQLELLTLSSFILFCVIEDFFAIIFNKFYGWKNFNSKAVTWHKWVWKIPVPYIKGLVLFSVLFCLAKL